MPIGRRSVLVGAGVAAATVAAVPAALRWMKAAETGAGFQTLTSAEAAMIGDLGEALVPGARAAGLAHYIDQHISVPAAQSLLMLRYLDVAPPFAEFYRAALAALAAATGNKPADWDAIAAALADGSIAPWVDAPPAGLFYFALRADAADVVYGTEAGFARLGVPYLPHIAPDPQW